MKKMKTPRGTARTGRRKEALKVLRGKGFRIYWNHGKPTKESLVEALKHRNA